jgi:hypothetical protein
MGWMEEELVFNSWQRYEMSLYFTAWRLAVVPTQFPIQWVLGALTLE